MSKFPWGNNRRFNSYTEFFRKTFGGRVQKVAVDAGFTCPNRDGTKGHGGCTYCVNDAFNPSYCKPEKGITRQIEEGIEFHKFRYRRSLKYIVYFQSYTNTYGDSQKIIELYDEALRYPGVTGLIIGTRPDCLDEKILEYLTKKSEKYFVSVELGIESVYDKTLKRINRGHTFSDTVEAVETLNNYGLMVGGHYIFGLPGETIEEMLKSVDVLSSLHLHSIKFHQLQIFKGTVMEAEYADSPGDFNLFADVDEYLEFMVKIVERLNPSICIDRIASEVPERFNAGQQWKIRYDSVLRLFEKKLEEKDTWQGKYFNN